MVEDQAAGPEAVAALRLEAGRLAVPVCGNLVARGAAVVAEPELAVVAAVGELVMAVESVAVEGREPAAERRGEPKVPGLENG